MKRYIISTAPVKNTITGRVIGYTVRMSDGSSYFTQTVRVPRGHCVNFGPTWEIR